MSDASSHGAPTPKQKRFGRPRLTTILAFAGGIALAAVLLPAAITAAPNNPPLNILISDPDNSSQHAKVDQTGALKVAGTATVTGSVDVANTPLPVSGTVDVGSLPDHIFVTTRPAPAGFTFHHFFDVSAGDGESVQFGHTVDMSLITFPSGGDDELDVSFSDGNFLAFTVAENEGTPQFMALTQPVRADHVFVFCLNEVLSCKFEINVVGSIVN